MHATKLRQISNARWLELQAHRQAKVLYESQHKAIADALQAKGLKMLKVMGRPVFKISDKYKTPIHYEAGQWNCSVEKYNKLIKAAIAGVQ